jgi:hypothetical protein
MHLSRRRFGICAICGIASGFRASSAEAATKAPLKQMPVEIKVSLRTDSNVRPPIVSRSDWGAKDPSFDYDERKINKMKREYPLVPVERKVVLRAADEYLTIHYTAVSEKYETINDQMKFLRRLGHNGYSPNPKTFAFMAEIPYHYYISRSGVIAEARDRRLVARTNTPASQYGREISKHTTIVLQDTQGSKLPEPQEKSLKDLAEYLLRNPLFHNEGQATKIIKLGYHSMYASSSCPGPRIKKAFPNLATELKHKLEV